MSVVAKCIIRRILRRGSHLCIKYHRCGNYISYLAAFTVGDGDISAFGKLGHKSVKTELKGKHVSVAFFFDDYIFLNVKRMSYIFKIYAGKYISVYYPRRESFEARELAKLGIVLVFFCIYYLAGSFLYCSDKRKRELRIVLMDNEKLFVSRYLLCKFYSCISTRIYTSVRYESVIYIGESAVFIGDMYRIVIACRNEASVGKSEMLRIFVA